MAAKDDAPVMFGPSGHDPGPPGPGPGAPGPGPGAPGHDPGAPKPDPGTPSDADGVYAAAALGPADTGRMKARRRNMPLTPRAHEYSRGFVEPTSGHRLCFESLVGRPRWAQPILLIIRGPGGLWGGSVYMPILAFISGPKLVPKKHTPPTRPQGKRVLMALGKL